MQVFPEARNVDARHSVFNEIHRDLVITDYRWLAAPDPSSNQDVRLCQSLAALSQ